jgi:polysaccharide export outer membrane protein
MSKRFDRCLRGWAACLAALALAAPAAAQVTTPAPAAPAPSSVGQAGVAANSGPPLLDAPVNRAQYLLGAGDIVTVSLTGTLNRVWEVPVSPEGALVVPELGVARVLDLNLDQAQGRVRDLVQRYYQGVTVSLTLSAARRFRVFLVGGVPDPGARVASAATRVSDLVPGDVVDGVVRRNVVVRRSAGDSIIADLVRFRQTGDLDANPPLREGDVLVVPAIERTVEVYGRVHFPGRYEYRPDETLADVLMLANAGGDFPANAADTVRVTRFVGAEQREFRAFSRAEAIGPAGRAFVLRPSDAVYISQLSNFQEQKTAAVTGQVLRQGIYPIRPGVTTVRQLVALAGGFTPEASLVDASLRRVPRGGGLNSLGELQNVPPELLSSDERRLLQARGQGDPNVLVLDFQRLFAAGGDALDQVLEAGDELNVPLRRTGVTVLGAVGQPGIVQHVPGRSAEEYIRLAGGYNRRADRGDVTVLGARFGSRTQLGDIRAIDPGDQIVVPFRERRTALQTLQSAQTIISTISGVVLTVIAFRQLFPRDP